MRVFLIFVSVVFVRAANAATQCVPDLGNNSPWYFSGVGTTEGNTWTRTMVNRNTDETVQFKGMAFGCGNLAMAASFTSSMSLSYMVTSTMGNCCCMMIEPYVSEVFVPVQGMDCNNLYDSCVEECMAYYRYPQCGEYCDIINYECDPEGA